MNEENSKKHVDDAQLEIALKQLKIKPVPSHIKANFTQDVMRQIQARKKNTIWNLLQSRPVFVRVSAPLLGLLVLVAVIGLGQFKDLGSEGQAVKSIQIAAAMELSIEEELLLLEEFDSENELLGFGENPVSMG